VRNVAINDVANRGVVMATFSRRAVLEWNGDVMAGAGEVTAATAAFAVPVTFGAHAYLRDVPSGEVHMFDSGHFALEEYAPEMALLIAAFLERVVANDDARR
jgi:hypothetical protein